MTTQPNRLGKGGRIDRNREVSFSFDGRGYRGFAGDTLAAALLANDVHLVGRSFKYHRPRGIVSAGVEEPNALATIRDGGRTEPNAPMTTVEIFDGLAARSQNAWPSPRFDVMAINGLFKPFLSAGFYYKTFMGPTNKSWMFFEPFIRKAAGLGAAVAPGPDARDPDRYEKVHKHADVLVVGAGPAGLAAALAAGRAGARVVVAEQSAHLGGELRSQPVGSPSDDWLKEIVRELKSMAHVRLLTRTTVFGAYDGGVFGLVERVADHKLVPSEHEPRQRYIKLFAKRAVIATGAIERPIPFADNDRPGVMLASAARAYLNRHAVRPGRAIVIMTCNDSVYGTASEFVAAGARVTVVDTRSQLTKAARDAAARGIAVRCSEAVVGALGRHRVSGALVGAFDAVKMSSLGGFDRVDADLILTSGGFDPQVHLATQRGHKAQWRADIAGFVTAAAPDIQHHAGAMAGTYGTADCVTSGYAAGSEAATAAGFAARPGASAPAIDASGLADLGEAFTPVYDVVPPDSRAHRKRFIDQQNDVSASDLKLAHLEGYVSVEHLKRYTTLGMATEQGKLSNVIALAQMAKLRGVDIAAVGTTGYRAPYTSVPLATLAHAETDEHLRPVRRTPFHRWHQRQGGVFLDVGLWKRAWYYPQPGEGINEAYRRETKQVRETVGMVDVSTLGKIDVQGPDAAEFLNRVYINGWKNLEIGKCRYGIMLREDGYIFDDGTTTRIGEHHYFLTTTTAEAAKVMAHLEWLLQTAWPDLKVHVTSVTDQWGGVAVAGPNARKMLADAIEGIDFADAGLPYMGYREGVAAGIPVRVHRLSFSGELAYEVYCGSGHGDALCEQLQSVGKRHGLVIYGVEALGALRIEKGHIAGGEIDGRTTLNDLGFAKMASKQKAYVGSVMKDRAGLSDPDRPRLVGLKPVDRTQRIRPGSVLQPHGKVHEGFGLGHVTSTTYSPQLGHSIALGLVRGGPERIGEVIDACYPLKDEVTAVEIVSPHFFDPQGKRLHG